MTPRHAPRILIPILSQFFLNSVPSSQVSFFALPIYLFSMVFPLSFFPVWLSLICWSLVLLLLTRWCSLFYFQWRNSTLLSSPVLFLLPPFLPFLLLFPLFPATFLVYPNSWIQFYITTYFPHRFLVADILAFLGSRVSLTYLLSLWIVYLFALPIYTRPNSDSHSNSILVFLCCLLSLPDIHTGGAAVIYLYGAILPSSFFIPFNSNIRTVWYPSNSLHVIHISISHSFL